MLCLSSTSPCHFGRECDPQMSNTDSADMSEMRERASTLYWMNGIEGDVCDEIFSYSLLFFRKKKGKEKRERKKKNEKK